MCKHSKIMSIYYLQLRGLQFLVFSFILIFTQIGIEKLADMVHAHKQGHALQCREQYLGLKTLCQHLGALALQYIGYFTVFSLFPKDNHLE